MDWDSTLLPPALARWIGYAAVFLLVGAAVFRSIVLPRAARLGGDPTSSARKAVTIARLAGVVLAVALVGRLYFQARSLIDPEEAVTRDILQAILQGQWGKGWLAQAAAALVALIGWRLAGRPAGSAMGTMLANLAALLLILSMPLTGHAVGLPAAGQLGYPMTALHVGTAAAWLGTLSVMLLAALGRRQQASPVSTGALIGAFSPVALVTGLTAIGAGVVVTWRYVGSIDALLTTDYGRVLLVKIGLLLLVAMLGAYNWRVVLPRLRRDASTPVRRSTSLEVGVAVLLLAATALLVSFGAPAGLSDHAGDTDSGQETAGPP
ncbi:MAG: CopD family protein [Gemmatimonadales bacterium]